MRLIYVSLIFWVLPLTSFAQEKWPEIDIRVNGIGSGSSYRQVLKKIGKPNQIVDNGIDECGEGGKLRSLIYPGLTIGILSDAKGRNFVVISVRITSTKWAIQKGIRIGAYRRTVITELGKAIKDESDPDKLVYVTKGNLGVASFIFRGGRLVEIDMQETLC